MSGSWGRRRGPAVKVQQDVEGQQREPAEQQEERVRQARPAHAFEPEAPRGAWRCRGLLGGGLVWLATARREAFAP